MTAPLKEWLDYGYKEVYAPEAEQMMLAALRAVVELHAEVGKTSKRPFCKWCDCKWPCPTIKEVEKALGRAIEKEVLRG